MLWRRGRRRTPAVQPGDTNTLHDWHELRRIVALARGDQQGQWAASTLAARHITSIH
ncbi:hypothetical protein [Streptomyces canus]|uniref:hypothetical protein n=1 Tax=Streptomyces canus TaxID=58343 RepID=UPI003F6D9B5F